MAEIADTANVSVKTVFVYFRSKEDLAFTDTSLLDLCVAAIERRPPAVTPVQALTGTLIAVLHEGGQPVAEGIESFQRGYGDSPGLHARLLRMWQEYEDRLTVVLAAEAHRAPTPALRLRVIGLVGILRGLTSPEMRVAVAGQSPSNSLAYMCDWLIAAEHAVPA